MVSVRAGLFLTLALLTDLSAAPAALAPADQQSLQRTFEKKQSQTRTFQARLRQTVRLKGMRDPIVSSGRLYYAAPDSLLIKFDRPKGEYVMMRADDFFMKKSGKEPVHRRLDSEERQEGLGMLVELFKDGAAQFRDRYDIRMLADASEILVVLTPKDEDSGPARIENRLLSTLEIRSVLVRFDEDQSILYEFIDPVRNKTIRAEIFQDPEAKP